MFGPDGIFTSSINAMAIVIRNNFEEVDHNNLGRPQRRYQHQTPSGD